MKRESIQELHDRLRAELAAEPENGEGWYALGEALLHQYQHHCIHRDYQGRDYGDLTPLFDETTECFRQAAKLEPESPRPWLALGNHYHSEIMLKQAIESYVQALDLDSTLWRSRLTLSQLYYREGNREEAERQVDIVFEAHPDNYQAQYAKAHSLKASGRFAEAIPLYQKVLEQEPRVRQALAGLGLAYAHLGQFERGEAYLWEAIELCDDCYDVHYALAQFYDLVGRTEEAAAMRRRAYELYRELNPSKKQSSG